MVSFCFGYFSCDVAWPLQKSNILLLFLRDDGLVSVSAAVAGFCAKLLDRSRSLSSSVRSSDAGSSCWLGAGAATHLGGTVNGGDCMEGRVILSPLSSLA